MKKHKIKIILSIVLLAPFLCWIYWPTIILWTIPFTEKKGYGNQFYLRKHLLPYKERAIGPILSTIKSNSTWSRHYAFLGRIYKDLSKDSYAKLIEEIEKENDAKKQSYLIYVLEVQYDDFDYLKLILSNYKKKKLRSYHVLRHFNLTKNLAERYPEEKEIMDANIELSEDYITWAEGVLKNINQTER